MNFALLIRRELEAIAYGWVGATPPERSVAGYFLTEVFDSLNYRIPPADR